MTEPKNNEAAIGKSAEKNANECNIGISKEQLINAILERNRIIKEKTEQLNYANSKLLRSEINMNDDMNKCDLLKDKYIKNVELQKKKTSIYENSFNTHIILFVLFILVLFWLAYHYMSNSKSERSSIDK